MKVIFGSLRVLVLGQQSHAEEEFVYSLLEGMKTSRCDVSNNSRGRAVSCCYSRVKKALVQAFGVSLGLVVTSGRFNLEHEQRVATLSDLLDSWKCAS